MGDEGDGQNVSNTPQNRTRESSLIDFRSTGFVIHACGIDTVPFVTLQVLTDSIVAPARTVLAPRRLALNRDCPELVGKT